MPDALLGLMLIALGCALPVVAAWAIVRCRRGPDAPRPAAHPPTPSPAPAAGRE